MNNIALLKEAREALFNMAPRFKERGCFGDRQTNCVCTACNLKRAILEWENPMNNADANS